MRSLRALGFLLIVAFLACQTSDKTVEGTVETHFSRQDGIEWAIEREIDNTHKSIDIAVYTFTSRPLAQALVDAKDRGVAIRVILNPSHSSTDYSKAAYLAQNDIDVHVERGARLMHHKFALIDDSILINGSFNWTASAEASNDENILILRGFPSTYIAYKNEFRRLWQESEPWEAAPEVLVLSASNLRQLKKNAGTEVTVKGKVVRVGHSENS
jgi:phosphatidylserine/phosphatidylglycerophosphate/cardiolipin synthase-like enzyme